MNDRIDFVPALTRPQLLANPVRDKIENMAAEQQSSVEVAEIDPGSAGGTEFCDRYGFAYHEGANCVLVEASRSGQVTYAACVITPGSRTDLNGLVRKHLGMRRVTLIPKDVAVSRTGMEYGSMTAVGLPKDWRVLVDARLSAAPRIIMGSGRVNSKLRLPGHLLLEVCRGESISDLALV